MTLLRTVLLALGLAILTGLASAQPAPAPAIPYWLHPTNLWPTPPPPVPQPAYCADAKDGVWANGTPVQLWRCSPGNRNQLWDQDVLGQLRLWAKPSLCLDAGLNPRDGSRVKLWTCYPGLLQQTWEHYSSIHGTGRRLNGTDLCLDVTDGRFANGTPLQVWKCAQGNWNQMITTRPVPVPY
ncbi:hypothetical protein Q8F55_004268 [Vanrija albida]|uniref:Ricin B lectin domain-containing protein n=1 Tax=Vanrija albida TaxID=181172 RepID=A0ABR3Q6K0_9TREE